MPTVNTLTSCHICDTVQHIPALQPGSAAHCICCDHLLLHNPRGGLDTPLALVLSSLLVFVVANVFSFLSLEIQGQVQSTTLSGAALTFVDMDMPILAFLVFFFVVLSPALFLLGLLYVLAALRFQWQLPHTHTILVWMNRLQPWGMMDVFMLGVLVALVKLSGMAEIVFGAGLYAYCGLIVLFAATVSTVDTHLLFIRMGQEYA